ncbi:hypothetical protein QFC21_004598 [Naganishia friedmannii]|uniref:Uncharacterized protein n=1 Tax=Naganishia friedmannii TaxID=89922 RepID=A0ACC2VGH6_9TREE|nr:hypothetical protein QFC21_004598 [Naganishia friedmannii]
MSGFRDTNSLIFLPPKETAAALEKLQVVERRSLSVDGGWVAKIDASSGHVVPDRTCTHGSSNTLSSRSSDIPTPALSDSATFSSNHTEGILSPENLSPQLESKVLKVAQKLDRHASPHHQRHVQFLQDTNVKSSDNKDVKQRVRELREAKTEASIKKAYEQVEAMRKKNEHRRNK